MDCTNCEEIGHSYADCHSPITSYGVIAFTITPDNVIKYLMIRRKDSFGYIDFVKGKYLLSNYNHITNSIDQMSLHEKRFITENINSFDIIWQSLFNKYSYRQQDYQNAKKKFDALKHGLHFRCDFQEQTLDALMKKSTTEWKETEWEFPKGRKLKGETEYDCAFREFEEETGYKSSCLCIFDNVVPFEEIFLGSNHRAYKHKYFIAYKPFVVGEEENVNSFQKSEVSKLEWKTLNECLTSMRPYHFEKKKIIQNVNFMLMQTTMTSSNRIK
jgi:8-oxo-dGTP pyrophosphatase MutT (NUDIX family)